MELTLTVVENNGAPPPQKTRVTTHGGELAIGRNKESDLVLPSDDVSRPHAQILFKNGKFFVLDNNSTNGVVLNSQKISKNSKKLLHDYDYLGIGSYTLQVSLDGGPTRQAATPRQQFGGPDLPEGSAAKAGLNNFAGHLGNSACAVTGRGSANHRPSRNGDSASGGGKKRKSSEPALKQRLEDEFLDVPAPLTTQYDLRTGKPLGKAAEMPSSQRESESSESVSSSTGEKGAAKNRGGDVPLSDPDPAPVDVKRDERSSDAVQAFFDGLGLDARKIPKERLEKTMSEAGQLLRTTSTGLLLLMRGRSELKREIRAQMTHVGSGSNNPFKFSADVDEALNKLFLDGMSGYQGPVESASEAFRDLGVHEMALIKAFRSALRALLDHFVPSELEKRFEHGALLDSVLPQNRKAKCWDLFADTYENVAADAAEDFRRLFRTAFQDAYEAESYRVQNEWQSRQATEKPSPEGR